MRVPGKFGTYVMRAGVALLALSLLGAGVADAAPKKKKQARAKSTVTRTVAAADTGMWKRGTSAIILDANTGRVLYEDNADALRHPASVTKVMTLYMLFEQLEARKLRLDSQLRVSAYAAAQQPTKLGLRAGTTLSVEEAIEGMVTRSANDAAVVVAEAIAGDASSFAALMTRRARQLGMSRTVFRNPHGLPNSEQVTTARDLATLGRAIQERFPRYYAYFSTRSFTFRGNVIPNHNRMFGRIEGVDGIKTGYTNASGFNLLTSVKTNGRYVIGVVMGGASAASRDNRMVQLISAALPKAYSGRQMVARMNAAPSQSEDDVPEVAVAAAEAPAPEPAPAAIPAPAPAPVVARAPQVIPVPAANPRVAMASAVAPVAAEETDSMTTASVPTPPARAVAEAAPAAAQVGSAQPITPVAVKTVAVARPAAPTATFSNQPGILGTLSFTNGDMTAGQVAQAPVQQSPAQKAIKRVQLASAGPTEIPRQEAETADVTAHPRAGGWGIQIGAYGSVADAQAQLAKAKAKAGAPLSKADSYVEQAVKGSTKIVRARFAGFDAEAAAQKACQALKRNDFSCMVFRN